MTAHLYRLLALAGRTLGAWFFVLVARTIAAAYFVFSPHTAESMRLYRLLYPEKSRWFHRLCTFRQYQNFTTIHSDRFLLTRTTPPRCTTRGWHHLEPVLGNQGGILLMSHLGNWEMAARLLKQRHQDLRMLLFMGIKEKEGIERMQKEDLRRTGIRIIGIGQEEDAPLSIIEGVRFLHRGGLVSMSGDLLWSRRQRRVRVRFLGHHADLPAAPYLLALLSGAPLFAFFSFRTGSNAYHVTVSEPIVTRAASRGEREAAMARAAQRYADLLEQALREHPLEWYHFHRFIQ